MIFATFEEDLGKKLAPEVEEAWTKLLVYMMLKLKEGYSLGREDNVWSNQSDGMSLFPNLYNLPVNSGKCKR